MTSVPGTRPLEQAGACSWQLPEQLHLSVVGVPPSSGTSGRLFLAVAGATASIGCRSTSVC